MTANYGEHLSSLLLGDGGRWLAVFDAFLDESGTGDDSPVVSVAGFYGNSSHWKAFREAWGPKSDDFHALRSDALFEDLLIAIEGSGVSGIYVTLGKDEYYNFATAHMKSFLGNPYAICAFSCAMKIGDIVASPLSVVLEHGQPNISFVKRILESMMDASVANIAAVASAKKSEFIELHPADFISHCASHYPDHKEWFWRFSRLYHAHITADTLKKVAPEISEVVRKARYERMKAKNNR